MGINIPTKKIYFFGETPIEGVSHLPLMKTHFIDPQISKLSAYDFIIVTSKRSIESLLLFNYDFKDIEIYCIGEKTASFAKDKNLNVKHTSTGYAKDFTTEIAGFIEDKKGLYIRPKQVANSYITASVEEGKLDEAICYETQCVESHETIEQPAVFLFAAPSQINCFLKHFEFSVEDKVFVIGETTAKALPSKVSYEISKEASLVALRDGALERLDDV